MSPSRFTPEFEDEAVRQITEQGYSVAEVSARLGGSAHSLYKWISAVKPDKKIKSNQINKPLNCSRQKAKFLDSEPNFTAQKRSATS